MRTFQIISGLLIISIGILLIFDRFTLLAAWAQQSGWYLDSPDPGFQRPGFSDRRGSWFPLFSFALCLASSSGIPGLFKQPCDCGCQAVR